MKHRTKTEWKKLNKNIFEAYQDVMDLGLLNSDRKNADALTSEFDLGNGDWIWEYAQLEDLPSETGRVAFPNHHISGVWTVSMFLEEVEAAKKERQS